MCFFRVVFRTFFLCKSEKDQNQYSRRQICIRNVALCHVKKHSNGEKIATEPRVVIANGPTVNLLVFARSACHCILRNYGERDQV